MSWVTIGGYITTAIESYGGYIAAASAIVGAGSAIASADAQRKAAHTSADIAKQRAESIAQQASVNEDAQRRRGAIAIGRGAAAAAEGTGLDGSNLDVLTQSATNAEMDALNIRYQGKLGTLSANDQASMDNASADNANTAGYLNAGAVALSAAGNYASSQARVNYYGRRG